MRKNIIVLIVKTIIMMVVATVTADRIITITNGSLNFLECLECRDTMPRILCMLSHINNPMREMLFYSLETLRFKEVRSLAQDHMTSKS